VVKKSWKQQVNALFRIWHYSMHLTSRKIFQPFALCIASRMHTYMGLVYSIVVNAICMGLSKSESLLLVAAEQSYFHSQWHLDVSKSSFKEMFISCNACIALVGSDSSIGHTAAEFKGAPAGSALRLYLDIFYFPCGRCSGHWRRSLSVFAPSPDQESRPFERTLANESQAIN
jgi:hypothetical protein